jgi:hypothetical protein
VEVLVGFGILGIGITSVITLFPFSALTIGQALRDDRTTTCAVIADGELRHIHQQFVVEPVQSAGGTGEPYFNALDNPNAMGNDPPPGPAGWPPPNPNGPSYPVCIDPMGIAAGRGPVGDGGQTFIPRVTFQFIMASGLAANDVALRYCSLMDSLSYDEDGRVPDRFDMRELRYNFAWVVQRPVNRDRFTLRMQVLVYNKRAHLYAPPGGEADYGLANFTTGETSVLVPGTADVRKGNWIMDAGNIPAGLMHAEFYRVLSVTDLGNGTSALELHKPVTSPHGPIGTYQGRLVVLPGVADVFERPLLTASPP